jgi:hypothetical protein
MIFKREKPMRISGLFFQFQILETSSLAVRAITFCKKHDRIFEDLKPRQTIIQMSG